MTPNKAQPLAAPSSEGDEEIEKLAKKAQHLWTFGNGEAMEFEPGSLVGKLSMGYYYGWIDGFKRKLPSPSPVTNPELDQIIPPQPAPNTGGVWVKAKNGVGYILVGDQVCTVVDFDMWEDGDFEADGLTDGNRYLISKNDDRYFVANAMNGYGENIRDKYKNVAVVFISIIDNPKSQSPSTDIEVLEDNWEELGKMFAEVVWLSDSERYDEAEELEKKMKEKYSVVTKQSPAESQGNEAN